MARATSLIQHCSMLRRVFLPTAAATYNGCIIILLKFIFVRELPIAMLLATLLTLVFAWNVSQILMNSTYFSS